MISEMQLEGMGEMGKRGEYKMDEINEVLSVELLVRLSMEIISF
jgi:hypothetical protein